MLSAPPPIRDGICDGKDATTLCRIRRKWFPSARFIRLFRAFLLALALINAAFLIRTARSGDWIYTSDDNVIYADFVSFWSTSLMLQSHSPAEVYDWNLHHKFEIEVLGPGQIRRLPWLNPPIFLLAVAPLAYLPYMAAFLSWVGVTFLAYVAAIRAILHSMPLWQAIAGALSFPAALWAIFVGQNGLLTGALIGGTLILLDKRPLTAGFFLGLLTYKPQFGILFPIVLIASARWKVFVSASVTALTLFVLTTFLFGIETWEAFWASLPQTKQAVLTEGKMGFYKLQSFYGAVLWLTDSLALAWSVQAFATLLVTAGLIWVWRAPISPDVRSASLAVGALLATPYVLIYDLPVLAISLAFLIRAGMEKGFAPFEPFLMLLAFILILAFPFLKAPVGVVACCLVATMICSRVMNEYAKPQHSAVCSANPLSR